MIKRWKNGPEFLLQPEDNWPVQKDIHGLPLRVPLEEAKKSSLDDEELAVISESITTNLAISDDSIQYFNIQDVINMVKSNSFQSLCRVTAVFRFIGNLILKKELRFKFAQKELISNNSKYEKLSSLKLYKDNMIYSDQKHV